MRAPHLILLLLPLLLACGGPVEDEPLVGPYRVFAADESAGRRICIWLGRDGCLADPLPRPTVVAAGFDEQHLVIVQRPVQGGPEAYYYVKRYPDAESAQNGERAHGPLTADQFVAEKANLGLPNVSRRFQP